MEDHEILLYKLQHYGICGNTLKWLRGDLHDRKQYVSIKATGGVGGLESPFSDSTSYGKKIW